MLNHVQSYKNYFIKNESLLWSMVHVTKFIIIEWKLEGWMIVAESLEKMKQLSMTTNFAG